MLFAKIFLIDQTFLNFGLGTDAKIYNKYIPDSKIFYISDKNLPKSKVNIYLETVPDNLNNLNKTAEINILMVNHEFLMFNNIKLMKSIDITFAKNRHTVNVLKDYRKHFNLKFKIYYTKFTSIINNFELKKNNEIVHLAGKSRFKMTDVIYKVWEKNPKYPNITITCYKSCYRNLTQYANIKNLNKLTNLKLYNERISNDVFFNIVSKAECYLCPSYMEGYGHYINEGRGNAAFIITTNGPPMNELIDNTCGILIDAEPKYLNISGFKYARSFYINENSLKNAMDRYMNLSKEEKKNMRRESYIRFKNDEDFFKIKMKKFYKKIMYHKEIKYE